MRIKRLKAQSAGYLKTRRGYICVFKSFHKAGTTKVIATVSNLITVIAAV